MSNDSAGTIVAGRWQLGRKLGSGGFGKVYHARGLSSRGSVAVKVSTGSDGQAQLQTESRVYRVLHAGTGSASAVGFPRPVFFGAHHDQKALVMDYLGPSLEARLEQCGRALSLHSVYQVAIQLLRRVEYMHSRGYIHRDIKPDNLLMGRAAESSTLYVVDFGLAKRFRDPRTKEHIRMREGKSLTGTGRYCSVHTHQGTEQSRRDDLETTGYVLVYLCKGRLPWTGIRAPNSREKYDRIRAEKEKITTDVLCADMGSAMSEYFDNVRNLGFETRPDYAYLRSLFRNGLERRGLEEDGFFDWMRDPDSRKVRRRLKKRS